MRRLVLLLAAIIVVAIPSTAQAWHAQLTCTTFHYVGAPVHLVWYQNGEQYNESQITSPWEATINVPTPPGYGKITVVGSWRGKDSPYSYTTTVSCGTPPTPTPTPVPTPTPTPPPTVTPPAPAPETPAPTVTVTQPPAKASCIKPSRSRFSLRERPNMRTLKHGRVTFRVRGPHIKWVRFHVDHRFSHTDRSAPFKFTTWLWRTDVWGPSLWGWHTVRVTVRTKCGTVHLAKRVFNLDPPA